MSVISQGFEPFVRFIEVSTIKPGGSGVQQNGNAYSASVKFRSQFVYTKDDPRVGLQEIEDNVEVKIPCKDEDEAIKVTELLRKLRSTKTPFFVSCFFPDTHESNGQYGAKRKELKNILSLENGTDFLKNHLSVPALKVK